MAEGKEAPADVSYRSSQRYSREKGGCMYFLIL